MTILDRYLGIAVIGGTLLALLLLVSVNTLIDFVNEVDDIGRFGYTVIHAILYTLFTIPRRVYEFFPTAVLLGGMLGLGNLAGRNELVVMRAAGLSVFQIIFSALKAGLVLMVGAFVLGEFVVPVSEQEARNVRKPTQSKQISFGTRDGLWARDGDRFLNIRDVYPDLRLGNIWVYQFNDSLRLIKSTFAKSAAYKDDHWLLRNVSHSLVSSDGVVTQRQEQESWDRLLAPHLFDVVVVEPRKMSARKLAKYVGYLKDNELDSSRYELAFWTRFTIPLSGVLMLLITVPFVFGPLRSSGAGQRLFIGVLIGVIFHLINQAANNLGLVYDLPPLFGAGLPLVVLLIIGVFAIKRIN